MIRQLLARFRALVADAPAAPEPPADSVHTEIADVRGSLQKMGAAFGAVATAIFAGLGWTQLHALFPLPTGVPWLPWVAAGSLLIGLSGAVAIFARLFAAQQRIILMSDLGNAEVKASLSGELQLVQGIFREEANEENAASLLQVELRANRLARLGRQGGDPGLLAESERLLDRATKARGHAARVVIEQRARKAMSGPLSMVALVLGAFGIAGLYFTADYSKGTRDLIDARAKCVKIAGAVTNACDSTGAKLATPSATPPLTPTEKQLRAQLACLKAVAGLGGISVDKRTRLATDCSG